ncbi:class I SAM-dependent rRNA methyltransferase [Persephonella sp.]
MRKVIIKNSAEDKIRSHNQWIYRNELKKVPKNIQNGEIVEVFSPAGKFLGTGYINPESKISLRMLTFFKRKNITQLLKERIKTAVNKRKQMGINANAYRLIHSEADFLPGLTADFYNGHITVQFNTAGMDRLKTQITQILIETVKPESIIDKSDEKVREKEGLETQHSQLYGETPDRVVIQENGINFYAYLKEGQKTGAFLDQRKNRKTVSDYVKNGFTVLDLFSNSGGFGIYSKRKGAKKVVFVDISDSAVKQVEENCRLNSITEFTAVKANAFDYLKEEKNKYDLIILDPPSFAKTQKEKEGALRGFKYLIVKSLKLLNQNGLLAVFSCSYHINMEDLASVSLSAAADTKSTLQIEEFMYQDKDHPALLNMPSTLYLKGLLMRKL